MPFVMWSPRSCFEGDGILFVNEISCVTPRHCRRKRAALTEGAAPPPPAPHPRSPGSPALLERGENVARGAWLQSAAGGSSATCEVVIKATSTGDTLPPWSEQTPRARPIVAGSGAWTPATRSRSQGCPPRGGRAQACPVAGWPGCRGISQGPGCWGRAPAPTVGVALPQPWLSGAVWTRVPSGRLCPPLPRASLPGLRLRSLSAPLCPSHRPPAFGSRALQAWGGH